MATEIRGKGLLKQKEDKDLFRSISTRWKIWQMEASQNKIFSIDDSLIARKCSLFLLLLLLFCLFVSPLSFLLSLYTLLAKSDLLQRIYFHVDWEQEGKKKKMFLLYSIFCLRLDKSSVKYLEEIFCDHIALYMNLLFFLYILVVFCYQEQP